MPQQSRHAISAWPDCSPTSKHSCAPRSTPACDEARRVGSRLAVGGAYFSTAAALFDLGEQDAAVMLVANAKVIHPQRWPGRGEASRLELLTAARDALGPERFVDLERRGARLTDDEAFDLARDATARALDGLPDARG